MQYLNGSVRLETFLLLSCRNSRVNRTPLYDHVGKFSVSMVHIACIYEVKAGGNENATSKTDNSLEIYVKMLSCVYNMWIS